MSGGSQSLLKATANRVKIVENIKNDHVEGHAGSRVGSLIEVKRERHARIAFRDRAFDKSE